MRFHHGYLPLIASTRGIYTFDGYDTPRRYWFVRFGRSWHVWGVSRKIVRKGC